jgi:hypothetical protein
MKAELTRWSLYHTGHHVVCTEQTGPGGLEVHVRYNNLPIAIQRCSGTEQAAEWAEQARFRWQSVTETSDREIKDETVDTHPTLGEPGVPQVVEVMRTSLQFGRPLLTE